jgi:hypothetical protein
MFVKQERYQNVSFFLLVLLIFLAYILWPVVKGMIYVRKVQRNVRDAFEQAARGNGPASNTAGSPRRKKKIDKDVGEYVEFEDITTASSSYSETVEGPDGSRRVAESESQVVDAEWEEIPPKR